MMAIGTDVVHSDSEEGRGEHKASEAQELGTPASEIPAHKGELAPAMPRKDPKATGLFRFLPGCSW
jgi:hypothetical protein